MSERQDKRTRVWFCCPTITRPFPAFLEALERSVPVLDAAGIDHSTTYEVGNPYISAARATMLRRALDAKADIIVFLDHDLSWEPEDLLRLIQTPGDVVAGTYRFKTDEVEYMGALESDQYGRPITRDDYAVRAEWAPAGFLKITAACVERFMRAYPQLVYGPAYAPSVDLFNHGAHEGVWYGEDVAFCRRWRECGGEVWIATDLRLTHHTADKAYPGDFFTFLRRQPGGDLAEAA